MRRILAVLAVLAPFAAGAETITSTTCTTSNTTGCVTLNTATFSGTRSVTLQITGTWSADLAFEGSLSSSTGYTTVRAYPIGGGSYETHTTSGGAWQVDPAGLTYIRVRATNYTSGTATVIMLPSAASISPDVLRVVGPTFGNVLVSGTVDSNLTQTTLTALDPPCTFVAAPPRTSLTTTPVDVPTTPLTGRTQMLVLNLSNTQEVWCCRGAGCTPTSTAAYVIRHDGQQSWDGIRDTDVIRCRSQAGTADINVQEASCG